MRKTCCGIILLACCVQHAFGQSDYRKGEIGANFSIIGADTKGAFNSDRSRDGLYGFQVRGAYNFSRYWGLEAEVSYHQRHFDAPFIDLHSKLTQVMAGIKLQDNSNTTRYRPFAHALAGVAHVSEFPRIVVDSSNFEVLSIRSGTGPAFALGGGLDIRLTRKTEIRVFQIDYNPSRIKGDVFQNVRLGIGVNFRF